MRVPGVVLRQVVVVEPYEGDTAVGPSYGAAATVRCRVSRRRRMVTATDGVIRIAEATLYCGPGETIPVGSRIAYDGDLYAALDVGTHEGHGSAAMLEVLLGRQDAATAGR